MSETHVQSQTIAIAGAGLLGRLLAWRLALQGHQVQLFEAGSLNANTPQSLRAAAFTAAGMIAPASEAVVSDVHVFNMGLYAMKRWPEWLAKAPSQLFFNHGSLLVAHPQDLSELRQFEQELQHIVPNQGHYQKLNALDIRELEPDLQPHFQQGLLLQDEGHLHNRELLYWLATQLLELGVEIFENTPVELEPQKITTPYKTYAADMVIDCRGMGAKTQVSTLRGVRGETLHVETNEIQLKRPVRLMHPRYQLYVVPKPNNRFIIGATQIESEDRSPVTLQSSLELSSALYTLSPAFAEARIIEMDTNLRPAFMDNLPKVIVENGLIRANGLFRHGFLLAPAVVDNILAHITKDFLPVFSEQLNKSH